VRDFFLPLSITMSLVSFGLIARWYIMPMLARYTLRDALTPFLLFHSFRHIGLAFLVVGVTSSPLDPGFAEPAAYGDLLAAGLAFVALIGLRLNWAIAIPLVWLFNIEGFLDLMNAVYRGFQRVPDGEFGATYFIPAIVVPALLVTHMIMFALLIRRPSAAKTEASA
jgi:hypothetical protein